MVCELAQTTGHVPVMAEQVLALLEPRSGQTCLDCTVGLGGHAGLIVPKLAPGGCLVGLDADADHAAASRQRLAELADDDVRLEVVHANFAHARKVLDRLGVGRVDLLLADLGFASTQVDDPQRGFSFQRNGPLDMRLDRSQTTTAADLVNGLGERELADLLYQYGQERLSRKIARKIVETRARSPIMTTYGLADLVRQVYGQAAQAAATGGRRRPGRRTGRWRIDPATRCFMAVRIAVNDEVESLRGLLAELPVLLKPGAVAAIVSFHSLEDRPVKQTFAGLEREGLAQRLTRRPQVADPAECRANRRCRSAKLRAIRWLAAGDSACVDG